jgi:hypothetical protein
MALSMDSPTGVTHASRGNSASKLQDLEVLSFQDSLRATPTKEYKVALLQTLRPTHDFLQMHLQEPEILFCFTSDAFCKRPVSSYRDSYVYFYKEIYKQR